MGFGSCSSPICFAGMLLIHALPRPLEQRASPSSAFRCSPQAYFIARPPLPFCSSRQVSKTANTPNIVRSGAAATIGALGCAGEARWGRIVPPFSGPTQAGTTPELNFQAAIGLEGEVELSVAI